MKQLIYIALFCISSISTSAQTINRIAEMPLTKSEIIDRGRSLLGQSVLENDVKSTNAYFIYLEKMVATPDTLAFSFSEKIALSVYLKKYENALAEIKALDSIQKGIFRDKIQVKSYPKDDNLLGKLSKALHQKKYVIEADIEKASISDEDKLVLLLTLDKMLVNVEADSENHYSEMENDINSRCATFFKNYPNSIFADYLRTNVYNEETEFTWGYGIHVLNGMSIFNGSLSNQLTNSFGANIGLNLYYKKFIFSIQNTLIPTSLSADLTLSDGIVLKEGSNTMYNIYDLNVGYRLIDNNRFSWAPFVGIGRSELTPNGKDMEQYPELVGQNLASMSYSVGMLCDFHFSTKNEGLKFPARLRLSYSIPTRTPDNSGLFSVSLGVDVSVRPKTVKKHLKEVEK